MICPTIEFKISDPISELTFMPNLSEIAWPLSPDQLPPLIIKPNNNNNNNATPETNTHPIIQEAIHMPTLGNLTFQSRETSYEKNRMNKLMRQIENFQLEKSHPYIWMQNNFGKIITQKEFNRIYRELKELLPVNKAPNRDVNRNQKLRFKWMNDVWDDTFSRNILQQLITRVMIYPE